MKIPPSLHAELMARHAAGQSDPAIRDWLARLDPPVTVSRVAILQTRQRLTGVKPAPRSQQQASAQVTPASSGGKASGAAGAKVRAARAAVEAAQHSKRGTVIINIPPETRTERAHLHALAVQLELQGLINADPIMTLPDKLRASCAIAQAMSKLSTQAELEKRIEQLEHERAVEAQVLVAERQAVEIERKRIEAERREIDEEWAKLRAERACQSAP